MQNIKITRSTELTTSEWSGGTTTQLGIYPEDSVYSERNFTWRISTARVNVEESVFTSLPGVDRHIMVLDGQMLLRHEGHHATLLGSMDQDSFSGSWTTTSQGQVTDFNLMTIGAHGQIRAMSIMPGQSETIALGVTDDLSWNNTSLAIYSLSEIEVEIKAENVADMDVRSNIIVLHKGDVLTVLHRTGVDGTIFLSVKDTSTSGAIAIQSLIYHN